jgi:hypothetical protein
MFVDLDEARVLFATEGRYRLGFDPKALEGPWYRL